jgi:hypothetical protein
MRMPTRLVVGEGSTSREVIDRCAGLIRRGNGNGTLEERSRLSGETRAGEVKSLNAIARMAARAGVGQGHMSIEAG